MGEPAEKTCPIVSAFSQVKDATGYPKCITDHCAWWTGAACAVQQLASVLGMVDNNTSNLGMNASSIQTAIQKLADKGGMFDDWQVKQGAEAFLRDTVGSSGVATLMTNIETIVRIVSEQLGKKELTLGG